MSSSFLNNPSVFPTAATVVIIVIAIAITAAVQGAPEKPFSQIITVGPVWATDAWQCTSDGNFMVYGTLRGIGTTPHIQIGVSGSGAQSFYVLNIAELESFSVGGSADRIITITRTGTVTGFITLQTTSDANASCTAI